LPSTSTAASADETPVVAGAEVAEAIRSYSNFLLPNIVPDKSRPDQRAAPTLVDQADGRVPFRLARDDQRPVLQPHLPKSQKCAVIKLYATEPSLSAIARQIGISWDSVGRILDDAGLRPMPNRRW
jgi:hypothetical protein